MRMFNFNAPQEALESQLFRRTVDLSTVKAGAFVRNAVLSGMTYGGNDLVPSFIKTCDAIHPMCGSEDFDGNVQSVYGALLDSANTTTTKAAIKSVVQPWNTSVVWAPGGQGLNSWLAVKLPEATLVEKYIIASTSSTCPLSWIFQASNDGANWTDVDTVTNTEMWSLNTREEKTFTIPAETRGTYLWYRLKVTATNATTMSISTFRLLRPAATCDRGQLLIDASAAKPLMLSFMNGFAADGVTPVDYTETLSSALVQALGNFDTYGTPISGSTVPLPIDIYAKRGAGGAVELQLEVSSATDTPYLPGVMTRYVQNGMTCTSTTTLTSAYYLPYQRWGASPYSSGSKYLPNSTLKRSDGEPFFVSKVLCSNYINNGSHYSDIYAEEIDGSIARLPVVSSSSGYDVTNNLNRYIKSLQFMYAFANNNTDCFSARVYGRKSPRIYRVTNGKMYQRDTASGSEWEAVQKIKIGSFVLNGTDFYQVTPARPFSITGMANGVSNTYLEP